MFSAKIDIFLIELPIRFIDKCVKKRKDKKNYRKQGKNFELHPQ